MDKSDSPLSMWESTRILWTKYIWISDEYRLLRDKWCYLSENLSPALPLLRSTGGKSPSTFDILDARIVAIDRKFKQYFRLERKDPSSLRKFRIGKIWQYSDLEKEVSDFSTYVGLLKLAFYQRTVSVEIPYTTSGYPHSPERTFGNELIYVAADRVAGAYMQCLDRSRHKRLPKWDGFVTYIPPITEELAVGAFCDIRPYGLVRIFLSERHKHALPSYLLLAHEIGHIPLCDPKTGEMKNRFDKLATSMIEALNADSKIRLRGMSNKCVSERKCKFYPHAAIRFTSFWEGILDQLFADTLGVEIGGPTTIEVMLNETLFSPFGRENLEHINKSSLLRGWAAIEYMTKNDTSEKRSALIKSRLKMLTLQYTKEENIKPPCFDCLEKLGRFFGQEIKKCRRRAFGEIIRKGMRFDISMDEEKELKNRLINGELCTETDPRKVLHCGFLASQVTSESDKDSGRRVCFASFLHSLAYNDFSFNSEV